MPNLKEQMQQLMADFDAAETIEAARDIKGRMDELQALIDTAEEKKNLLDSLNSDKETTVENTDTIKTLGEFAEKNLDFDAIKSGNTTKASTSFGFKAATDPHLSVAAEVVDRNVVSIARDLQIRSLFGAEAISGNSLKYFVLGATEGAPAETAENAAKPQFHVPYTAVTKSLEKIAGWYYETDELLEDNEFLRTSIDNRGLFELDQAIETYLMTELLGTSGIQTISQAPTADNIFTAIMNVKAASNYDADAIVINPADYQTLRTAKDATNGQYYGGGYFYGPYGNGIVDRQPGLWGLTTIISNAVSAGTVLVGAFKQGAAVVTKANEGARIEVVTGDHDDRTHNRVTVIVEERLLLAARVPAAFVKISA